MARFNRGATTHARHKTVHKQATASRARSSTVRRAAISAMGFGGIDAHCVLEEHD